MKKLSTAFYARCTNMHAKSQKFTRACNYTRIYTEPDGRDMRIKEASAKAIITSADAFSYFVTSGTVARDIFGVLT